MRAVQVRQVLPLLRMCLLAVVQPAFASVVTHYQYGCADYVGPESRSPGFKHVELKPYTKPSIGRFFDQLLNWSSSGQIEGDVALFFYNQAGNMWWSGFLF